MDAVLLLTMKATTRRTAVEAAVAVDAAAAVEVQVQGLLKANGGATEAVAEGAVAEVVGGSAAGGATEAVAEGAVAVVGGSAAGSVNWCAGAAITDVTGLIMCCALNISDCQCVRGESGPSSCRQSA